MLLSDALIKAGLLTEAQLHKAIQAQGRYPDLSLAEVITKLFAVPRETMEGQYLSLSIIPFIQEWLQQQMDARTFSDGTRAGSIITDIAITVPTFTRFDGETITYNRHHDGTCQASTPLGRMEKIMVTVDPLVITTITHQQITLHDIHLEVDRPAKGVKPNNPGLLSEIRLLLLKAFKEKA